MNLEKFGYNNFFEPTRQEKKWEFKNIARVISDCRELYLVQTSDELLQAEITGKLRYTAVSRSDFPTVGDWVVINKLSEGEAIIHELFPRKTILARKAINPNDRADYSDMQIIAANVDKAFIVVAANRDFSINRVDRYLALTLDQGIEPIVVLNKCDLIDESELDSLITQFTTRNPFVTLIKSSALSHEGLDDIRSELKPARTFCFIGSSGVGKSTLLNYFAGETVMKTQNIGIGTDRGKHTTTKRELVILENGALLIDTPGMRQIGVTDVQDGIANLFEDIEALVEKCKFSDCKHESEPGCAIRAALVANELDEDKWINYQKLQREAKHYGRTAAQKRSDAKEFAKHCARVMKARKHEKFG